MPPSEPSIDQAIDSAITAAFLQVAPEADLSSLDPKVDFRSVLDIDSFDFLNLMLELHKRLGVDVPESDYPRVRSLDGCRRYLRDRLAVPRTTER